MDGDLGSKISQGEKGMTAFLVLSVAALHFAVVPGGVRADELVADTKISGSFLKKGLHIPFAVGKTVSEFDPIVGLDTLHADASTGVPLHQPFQEVGIKNRWTAQDKPPKSGAWKTHRWRYTGTGAAPGL